MPFYDIYTAPVQRKPYDCHPIIGLGKMGKEPAYQPGAPAQGRLFCINWTEPPSHVIGRLELLFYQHQVLGNAVSRSQAIGYLAGLTPTPSSPPRLRLGRRSTRRLEPEPQQYYAYTDHKSGAVLATAVGLGCDRLLTVGTTLDDDRGPLAIVETQQFVNFVPQDAQLHYLERQ